MGPGRVFPNPHRYNARMTSNSKGGGAKNSSRADWPSIPLPQSPAMADILVMADGRREMEEFQNEIIKLMKPHFNITVDQNDSNELYVVFRAAILDQEEAIHFLDMYCAWSNTRWIVLKSLKCPTKVVYRQKWLCHLNKRNKSEKSKRNLECEASVDITIKKVNRHTARNDAFLKQNPPLPALIKIFFKHSHPINTADALRLLRVKDEVKQQFFDYFADGMTPSQAINLHESRLLSENDSFEILANAAVNPTVRQVYALFDNWRYDNLGTAVNPFDKLLEKTKAYEEHGATVCVNKDSPWAVLIVTSVMKRTQNLDAAEEMIFLDSTSSCESSGSTLTVMLTATKGGAIPIAVLIHQYQTTESYIVAFKLLQSIFPLCFGGKKKAPIIFMTDDSAAERTALYKVWPTAQRLLCHFHVAQAEWRWIWSNIMPKEDRRQIMKLFQEVMYANTKIRLDNAVKAVLAVEKKFPAFTKRFRAFFLRKDEWVLLFRMNMITRNNNTNNFSEATMRILKDIILCRTKAFNVVALTEFCISVWDKYLIKKLLDYAYNRKGKPALLYEGLSRKMSGDWAPIIRQMGNNIYSVQSGSDSGAEYTVDASTGVCSCIAGRSGAFCKHQCLLVNRMKITLPNIPAVTQKERHALGLLALGNKCPPFTFFQGCREIAVQQNTAIAEVNDGAIDETLDAISEEMPQTLATEDDKREFCEEIQRWLNICSGEIPKKNLQQLLASMRKIKSKDDVISSIRSAALAISVRHRARYGKKIKVQPTSIVRRRSGITRGCFRVPAGRPPAQQKQKRGLKRKRCLGENINLNQAHAKSHGP